MKTTRITASLLAPVLAVLALSTLQGCVVRARPRPAVVRPVVVRPAPVVVIR